MFDAGDTARHQVAFSVAGERRNHMDKYEAAERIGVSIRTIARMVAQGEISALKVRGNRGAETYDFDPEEVERVRELKNRPAHVGAVVKYEPHPLTTLMNDPQLRPLIAKLIGAFDAMSDAARHQVADRDRPDIEALDKKIFLTIEEAAALSGLGKGYLRQAIEDGKLAAIPGAGPRGATVVRRGDLDKFAQGLGSRPRQSKGRAKR